MSKIFVFGCSHSSIHGENTSNELIKKYKNLRNDVFPKTWSELLAESMNHELINLASWGQDNYTIFNHFCGLINQIKKDDIVFIGWTETNRFRLFSEKLNRFLSLNAWSIENNDIEHISQKTINEILINRRNHNWAEEVHNWIKLINKLSELVGFKVIHWSFYGIFSEYNILDELMYQGLETIHDETNGIVNDRYHLGEKGHKVQCDYFKGVLNNR
jgi:hypothetical protein